MREDIDRLFHPRSVAVIGGISRSAPDAGLRTLVERFGDRFALVDPAGGRIGDRDVVRSIAEVPGRVDLAVINLGAAQLMETVRACGEAGVAFALISSAGFGEGDENADERERELVALARRHGMRVIGPNGSINIYEPMAAPVNPSIGRIALITQSGHMGRLIFQSAPHGVAFSRWVPTGNESDLEAADYIEYFAEDPGSAVIAGYFEGFRDPLKLRRALAAAAAADKPVVLIKVGRHQASSRMAETHTAHLTGSDVVVDGLFRQYGVIRVDDVDELIETAALHAKMGRQPVGDGVALYGYAGGAVALMADVAEAHGVRVPTLADATQRRLHEVLPEHLGVANPVDNGNLYRGGTPAERRHVLEAIADDPDVAVLVLASTGFIGGVTDDFIDDIIGFAPGSPRPIVVTWSTWDMSSAAYARLVASGLPIFRSFRNCFQALHGLFERRRRGGITLQSRPGAVGADPAHPLGRMLTPGAAAAMLARHGLPMVPERIVKTGAEALAAALELGLPAVLKVDLPGFPHRSDVGLVRTGLVTAEQVTEWFATLVGRAAALAPEVVSPDVIVQAQAAPGVEVIVGVTRDATIGPAILVGLGGVLTEVLHDVSVRPLPITRLDAVEMLDDLRGRALLDGVRGSSPADREALVSVLMAVSELALDPSNRVVSLDLNPVIVGARGAVAVDCLVEVAGEVR